MRKITAALFVAATSLSGVAMADQYSEIAKDTASASQGAIKPNFKWAGFSESDVYSQISKDVAQTGVRAADVKKDIPMTFMWDLREDPYAQFNNRS